MNVPQAIEVYAGSDGEATKAYYALLLKSGPVGEIAMNLFRAQKCSVRAKKYRGGIPGKGSYRSMAYDRKNYAIAELCKILTAHPECGISFGWKEDPGQVFHRWVLYVDRWVLYVDLPEGQVSFHAERKGLGPNYIGEWDKQRQSAERIMRFCDRVVGARLSPRELPQQTGFEVAF